MVKETHPHFTSHVIVLLLDRLTLKYGTDMLSRNAGN